MFSCIIGFILKPNHTFSCQFFKSFLPSLKILLFYLLNDVQYKLRPKIVPKQCTTVVACGALRSKERIFFMDMRAIACVREKYRDSGMKEEEYNFYISIDN